jgi:hypothetical protein
MEMELKKIKPAVSNYLGKWVNTYDKARIISEFTFFENNGELLMTITGSKTGNYPGNWKTVPVKFHAYTPDTNDVVAFQAHLDYDELEIFLAINENKGLLVMAGYFTFKKNDGRSDFFVREFFHKI